MSKAIKITCKGQKYLPVDQLEYFQGNLKESTREEIDDLKKLIVKKGFSFPVFVWNNKIINGHRRIFAVRELLKEGYTIEDIPICEIEAKDEKEAAEKVLMENSKFGKITDEGLYEFISEHDVDIMADLPELRLTDINLDKFIKSYVSDETGEGSTDGSVTDNYAEQYGVIVICDNEDHQEKVYNSLMEHGYNCQLTSKSTHNKPN